jgi:hypothetical protein
MRQYQEKFVIILESEPICIGPFDKQDDAELYKKSDLERDEMRTMQIVAPEPFWRKKIGHSAGETKARDRLGKDRSRRRERMSTA